MGLQITAGAALLPDAVAAEAGIQVAIAVQAHHGQISGAVVQKRAAENEADGARSAFLHMQANR